MSTLEYKLITRHLSEPAYTNSLADYQAVGGYATLQKALKKSPEHIREAVLNSGLRGRGGAGFPTGLKWKFLDTASGKPVYLICNADESEPGTFKDRQIIYKDPHQLLEGLLITAHAIGARRAFIYVRGEFNNGARILEDAIATIDAAGFTEHCSILVHRGAGAYICGEETGLIESLEGKRGYPRIKPPYFPATLGLYHCPSIVNNVETLCQVKHIIELGAEAYRKLGVPDDPGTHIYGVSGHVRRPGLYEVESGKVTFGQLLHELAGGPLPGRSFKALIPGGSSTKVLKFGESFELKHPRSGEPCKWGVEDIPLDTASLALCGTALGTAGAIVMDDSTPMLQALGNLNNFYAHESCGQCTPCREGSLWLQRIHQRINKGQGSSQDIPLMGEIVEQIEGRTICAFGEAIAWPVRSGIAKFSEAYQEEIENPRSSSLRLI